MPKVLVVDHHARTADLWRRLFEHNGYAVRVAHSAESALSESSDFGPDVVIVDMRLPGDTGKLARTLKEEPGLCRVVIGLGGSPAGHKLDIQCLDACLPKPVSFDVLVNAIERHFVA